MTKRWMAEITYRTGRAPLVEQFEELYELHDIVETGPNWNEIEQIIVTLNLSSVEPQPEQGQTGGEEPGEKGEA
jgi:hypothetical protein